MKISDIMTKVDSSFTVNRYNNGFMFEISGRDEDDEYTYARIVCSGDTELLDLVQEAVLMPLDT